MLRDSRFQRFEVLPLTGALGADVRGIDLAVPPDDATFEDLRRALYEHHVLAVRGQTLTPHDLHRVARRFGPFSGNPIHVPIDGFDDILRFVREAEDTGKVVGEEWHMDLAWLDKPPGITMLYGEVIPPVGGDTCFVSLEQVYRALSPGMKTLLGGLVGVHSGRGVYATNAAHARLPMRADAAQADDVEVEHPLVCAHPVTGRRYLFLSSVLRRFVGMTEEESQPIVEYLMRFAIRPEFSCRVRWAVGTLTMWANPFVLHTAIGDYAGHRRVTYRTTVEGWSPRAAPEMPEGSVPEGAAPGSNRPAASLAVATAAQGGTP